MDGDDVAQDKVKSAIKAWTDAANIRFAFVSSGVSDIRISFRGRGHWSVVGTQCMDVRQDAPTMNLELTPQDGQDEYNRVARHEFGHALGLMHEHQHPKIRIEWNKPAVYAWYAGPPNSWSREDVDAQIFSKYNGPFEGTRADPNSIMMYPILKGWTLNGLEVGWNRELSPLDKQFIKQQYP